MTCEKFKKSITEMVFLNSLPLKFFSTPAFVAINGEMARKLGVSLDRESIRNLVLAEAQKQKEILKNLLRGNCVYLKMDGCTRHRVNYFAINIQFVDDAKKFVTRTLAIRDTEAHHTSSYLQEMIKKVLNDFDIKKEQVLCIVTDNASNMLSTVSKLNKNEECNDIEGDDVDDESKDVIFVDEDDGSEKDIDEFLEAALDITKIHHMRCVVHTLQLAIRDGLKEKSTNKLLAKIRSIVATCRNPKLDAILKRRANKGA